MASVVVPGRAPGWSPMGKRKKRVLCTQSPSPRPKKMMYKKWTEPEKEFARGYRGKGLSWTDLALKVNTHFGGQRSAKSCQSLMNRLELEGVIDGCSELPELRDVGVQTDLSMCARERSSGVSDVECRSLESSILRTVLNSTDHVDAAEKGPTPKPYGDHTYTQQKPPCKKSGNNCNGRKSELNMESVTTMKTCLQNPEISDKLSGKEVDEILLQLSDPWVPGIVQMLLSIPVIKNCIVSNLSKEFSNATEYLRQKKNGYVSVLMKKDFESLKNLKVDEIIEEFRTYFPDLLRLLLSVMVPKKKVQDDETMQKIAPRLCLIYSILIQTKNHELSRMQRAISLSLVNNITDQEVFDRLNRFGICAPYCVALNVMKDVGNKYEGMLTDSLRNGKFVRFIGDNLNFSVGVKYESPAKHKHMEHMFISSALVSDRLFLHKPDTPQIDINDLTIDNILMNSHEYTVLRKDVAGLIIKTVAKHLPQLAFMENAFVEKSHQPEPTKTEVIPLPCLPFNETKYQDDVQILDWYQALCRKLIHNSGIDAGTRFVVGGDQLTRERFSEALLLRLNNIDPDDRFGNIGRCVCEFFHLGMNYLQKAAFDELWNEDGLTEIGTLKGECQRIIRSGVDTNIMKAYDQDKRYFVNFTNAYIVEAVMEHFQLDDRNSNITSMPNFASEEDQTKWVQKEMGTFVDKYVYPSWNTTEDEDYVTEDITNYNKVEVTLADGTKLTLPLEDRIASTTLRKKKPDKKKDYAHFVLEVGLTFKYFLELAKNPDREKFLPLLKMIMLQLKGHSRNAKYPREILRLLIQQYSVMGLKEACQIFHACFVNLHGKTNGSVPADLVQEWNVREAKQHIKHMFSNKSENNILSRTSAIPGIESITKNLDREVGTVIRAKRHKHKVKDDELDEIRILDDLRVVRPFKYVEGRSYHMFPKVPKSLLEKLDSYKLREWFSYNKWSFLK